MTDERDRTEREPAADDLDDLKEWKAPELIAEDVAAVTEGGPFDTAAGDDVLYKS